MPTTNADDGGQETTDTTSHTCPNCDHVLASDEPREVYAEIRSSGYGLRIDTQFVCENCGTELLLEDAATTDGVFGQFPDYARFDGGDYRA